MRLWNQVSSAALIHGTRFAPTLVVSNAHARASEEDDSPPTSRANRGVVDAVPSGVPDAVPIRAAGSVLTGVAERQE